MAAHGSYGVVTSAESPVQNFEGHEFKPLIAIRNQKDFETAISRAEQYTRDLTLEYEKTLRHVLSELMYNTLEHGVYYYDCFGRSKRCPSILQFTWYKDKKELSFLVGDLGVGIKRHLENSYPTFGSDADAIRASIRPHVSGTFRTSDPYSAKNNAGVGLYISSAIVRRLKAEMFIISGNGLLHISPADVTDRTLLGRWPGTFVLVNLKLKGHDEVKFEKMMSEFREAAKSELSQSDENEEQARFRVSIENYFGRYADNKEEAINFRNRYLLPAVDEGKALVLDFSNVVSSPHSFLSALVATPIRRYGMMAYKKIKVVGASAEIRETLDYILDENTTDAPAS